MNLASFDIFDTTLIRRFGKPKAIDCLIPGTHSEGDELERKIEFENLTLNPSVAKFIEKKRQEGWRIAFISDMYLDGVFLTNILKREGCYKEGDAVYISCDHDARKDTGTLYDLVRNELKPEKWEHFGDNLHSDFKMAVKKGIDATLYKSPFSDFENNLMNNRDIENAALFAGLSRASRMKNGDNAHSALSSDFVAAAYIPYVVAVSQWARQEKVDHLYFLSRDSYVLMKGYESLIEGESDVPAVHYLFVSRRSLLLPFMHLAGTDLASHYLSCMDHSSIKGGKVSSLLKALGTDVEELRQLGVDLVLTKVHNSEDEKLFLGKVFNGAYLPILKERASKAYNLLVDYFKNQGLLDAEKAAMVDIGWLGTSRMMINAVLEHERGKKAVFYYYGIRQDVIPESYGKFNYYLKSDELSTEATTLIENYYSASPYATTIGYCKDNQGVVIPVFPERQVKYAKIVADHNVAAISYMIKVLKEWHLTERPDVLKKWSVYAMDQILALKVDLDLTPLSQSDDFDTQSFVRSMSFGEVVRYSLFGQHITAFDKASLRYTGGNRLLFSALSTMHNVSEFVRRKLYQMLVK